MNIPKLKGYLLEKGASYSECAKATNMSITSFSNKLNGKSNLDIVEINDLVTFLKMPQDVAAEIFLTSNLH
jgi:hypothetical protein